jgi:GTP-binding protein EngB required for normal cell division
MVNGSPDGQERLKDLEQVAVALGAAAVADEARTLAERVAEGRFFVACVGQFKRGKSTLINALVNAPILPTGTVPVTSVVTVLRHGDRLRARLRTVSGDWQEIAITDLPDYVTEERNPGNAKGVIAVEVHAPTPLLATGLCFVDTPGLGSVFEANTEATRDFVPHVDAALVVFGADPPISGEETALAQEIARHVDTFVFVLNKADRVSPQECAEAAEFARRVLTERLGQPVERVFQVSAMERLTSGHPSRDWEALETHLRSLAEGSGSVLVQSAVDRGIARLSARLSNIIAEEEAALRRPIEETEARIRALRQASDEAARALWELGPLFDAEMRRLSGVFETRRNAFIAEALQKGISDLAAAIRERPERFGPALRAAAFGEVQRIARAMVLPWLRSSEHEAAVEYRTSTERFSGIVNDLLTRLRGSDSWIGIPLPEEVGENGVLQGRNRFLFDTFTHVESPAGLVPMLEWIADALLPRAMNITRIERAARNYLQRLIVANAHRVENSIKQRLQDSRMKMESEIRYALKEVLEAAERGMERARATQTEGREAVEAAVAHLEELRLRIGGRTSEEKR